MAAVETSLAYASLILADSEIEISAENLATLTEKANVAVDKIYTTLFAKALEGKDLKEFFFNFSAAPAAGAAGAAAGSSAAAEEAAEEEEEAAEESDDDMGLDLFG